MQGSHDCSSHSSEDEGGTDYGHSNKSKRKHSEHREKEKPQKIYIDDQQAKSSLTIGDTNTSNNQKESLGTPEKAAYDPRAKKKAELRKKMEKKREE